MKKLNFSIVGQPWFEDENIKYIFRLFKEKNFQIRIVGGAIRNAIMLRKVKDIDFATDAKPEQMLELCRKNNIRSYDKGKKHGTIEFIIKKKHYEITSLRQDIITDGRHAVVRFGKDWSEDAKRRDFTFNALYADENGNVYEEIENSLLHCREKKLVFIGEPRKRIQEDYLRALRYFRFLAIYSDRPADPEIIRVIKKLKDNFAIISAQRIRQELEKIFLADNERLKKIFYHIDATQLLASRGLKIDSFDVFDNWAFSKRKNFLLQSWLLFVSGRYCEKYADILALTKEEKRKIERLEQGYKLADEMQHDDNLLYEMFFEYGEKNTIDILLAAACRLNDFEFYRQKRRLLQSLIKNKFPLNGADLLKIGIKQGVEVGAILKKLKKIWIKSEFNLDKKQLLQQVKNGGKYPS